ncbi:hypothetical protein L7F22_051963 [Adiantum nelumboides]|nr:hypothetical protein [Adiantum nelumboides]
MGISMPPAYLNGAPDIAPDINRHEGTCWHLIQSRHHGFWYNFLAALPVVLFLAFLLVQSRRSVQKLLHGRSYVMATYYGFLWAVAFLNLIWFLLQVWPPTNGKTTMWDFLSLVVSFGIVMLEVSVVVFLSQGYVVSGSDALLRTVIFSSLIATTDTFIKALYIYGLGVPLFLTKDGTGDHKKWTFWLIRSLLFVGAYLFILVLPHTKWRDRLPARPTFYRYVVILFVLNALSALGHALICVGADFGYCLHGLSTFFYNGFYPPLLYATFLLDYFLEDDVHLDDIYYSEMKDAGYFETWD